MEPLQVPVDILSQLLAEIFQSGDFFQPRPLTAGTDYRRLEIKNQDRWRKRLDELVRLRKYHDQLRTLAREEWANDDLAVDDDCLFSEGDDGVWVQAWVFLNKELIEKEVGINE